MNKYSQEEIKELAVNRYGNDLHLFAKQRDGFMEGFKKALSMNKSITFDHDAQKNLPQSIKDKMKVDKEKSRLEIKNNNNGN